MRLPFLLLPLPLLLIPLWKEVAGQASKEALADFDKLTDKGARTLPEKDWKLTTGVDANLNAKLDLRYWHVGIQSAPEYWPLKQTTNSQFMATYAWGNPHFICVNVPHMWYDRHNPAEKDKPEKIDSRIWSRFPTAYSMFWIDEPTSFRWNRRFDMKSVKIHNVDENQWEPMTEPGELYVTAAPPAPAPAPAHKLNRWQERKMMHDLGLHFRVEVKGVKEEVPPVPPGGNPDLDPPEKAGFLKGWYHLKITLNKKNEVDNEKVGYFIDRMVVSARGLSWSVSTDGSYHQWALGSKYADQVLSHKPRRTWQGGIGEFVYDFPRTLEDGRDGSDPNAKDFSYVRRQFIPCAAAQPTQTQLGNNFFYVRAANEGHSQKYGGKWDFVSREPIDGQPIELYYRLDQSFCNKFIAIDFVVNGVAIHNNLKKSINNWSWNKWMEERGNPVGNDALILNSYAVEASSSTRIVFLPDVTDTELMGDVKTNRPDADAKKLDINNWWTKGLIPVFYENADPIPRHQTEGQGGNPTVPLRLTTADLQQFVPTKEMNKQSSDSFFGAIKKVVPFATWPSDESAPGDRGLTWSFWDLYHLPEGASHQAYRDLVVGWHVNHVKEWNWWTPNNADGMPNHWPAVTGNTLPDDPNLTPSAIADTLLYVPPNGDWKPVGDVDKIEAGFFDPTNLPYFDSTPLTPFLPHAATDGGPNHESFLPRNPTYNAGDKTYDPATKHGGLPELFAEPRRDGIVGRHNGHYFNILRNYPVISGRSGGIWAKSLFYGAEFTPQPCDLFQSVYYVSGTNFKKEELMKMDGLSGGAITGVGLKSGAALGKDDPKNWDLEDIKKQINLKGNFDKSTLPGELDVKGNDHKFNMYNFAFLVRGQWRRTFKNYDRRPTNPIATADPILRYLRWWMKQEQKIKNLQNWTDVYYNLSRFDAYCTAVKSEALKLNEFKCPELPANPSTLIPPKDRAEGQKDNLILYGDYLGGIPTVNFEGVTVPGAPGQPYGEGGRYGPGGPYGIGGPYGFGGPFGPCDPSLPPPPGLVCPPKIPGQPGQEGGPGGPYGPGGPFGPMGPFGPGGTGGPPLLDPFLQTVEPPKNITGFPSFSSSALGKGPVLPQIARKGKLMNTPFSLFVWDSRLIHGITMTIITFLVLPVNLFLTRYYKETFNDSRAFLHHVWFFVHVIGALIILLMFLYGMWRQYESRFSLGVSLMTSAEVHRGIGWIVIAISIILTLTGGIRHMSKGPRAGMIAVHWALGTLVYVGLLICIYSAMGIPGSPAAFNDVSDKNFGFGTMTDEVVFWMATVWIIFDLSMHGLMTWQQFKSDKEMVLTSPRLYLPTPIPVLKENYRFDSPGRQCRIHLLRLYVIIAVFVTLVPCYAMYAYNPRRRGLGFMSCTHFFNRTTQPVPVTYEKDEVWILNFQKCVAWPKKCGGPEAVPGCD